MAAVVQVTLLYSFGCENPMAINDSGQIAGQGSGFAAVWTPDAGGYTQTYLSPWSSAGAITAGGQVGGSINSHAALWPSGSSSPVTMLPEPGGTLSSVVYGLTDSGSAVGITNTSGRSYATLWTSLGGVMTGVDLNSGLGGRAAGINSSGQIAGQTTNDYGGQYASLWETVTAGDAISVTETRLGDGQAWAINETGHVAGISDGHATLWDPNGTGFDTITLDTPAGDYSGVYGLNDSGYAVGYSGGDYSRAALWVNGQRVDLNQAGWEGSSAYAINNQNQIIGSYWTAAGESGGFMIQLDEAPEPGVPEPCSLALLPMAFSGLAIWRRRRKA